MMKRISSQLGLIACGLVLSSLVSQAETFRCKSESSLMNGQLELEVVLGNFQQSTAEVSAGSVQGSEGIQCQVQRHVSRMAELNCGQLSSIHPFTLEVHKRERLVLLKSTSDPNTIRLNCQ